MRASGVIGIFWLSATGLAAAGGCTNGSSPSALSNGAAGAAAGRGGAGGNPAAGGGAGGGSAAHGGAPYMCVWDCYGSYVCKDGTLYLPPRTAVYCTDGGTFGPDACPPPTNPVKQCPNGCDANGVQCASGTVAGDPASSGGEGGAGAGGVGGNAGGT